MSDILDKWGLRNFADNFFYQHKPQAGYYCIYRRRAGEAGIIPDCPNISETTKRHAAQLLAAGVDYAVLDR